jgi:hypothetical protein
MPVPHLPAGSAPRAARGLAPVLARAGPVGGDGGQGARSLAAHGDAHLRGIPERGLDSCLPPVVDRPRDTGDRSRLRCASGYTMALDQPNGVAPASREMRQGGVPQPPVGEHLNDRVRV